MNTYWYSAGCRDLALESPRHAQEIGLLWFWTAVTDSQSDFALKQASSQVFRLPGLQAYWNSYFYLRPLERRFRPLLGLSMRLRLNPRFEEASIFGQSWMMNLDPYFSVRHWLHHRDSCSNACGGGRVSPRRQLALNFPLNLKVFALIFITNHETCQSATSCSQRRKFW